VEKFAKRIEAVAWAGAGQALEHGGAVPELQFWGYSPEEGSLPAVAHHQKTKRQGPEAGHGGCQRKKNMPRTTELLRPQNGIKSPDVWLGYAIYPLTLLCFDHLLYAPIANGLPWQGANSPGPKIAFLRQWTDYNTPKKIGNQGVFPWGGAIAKGPLAQVDMQYIYWNGQNKQ
jgi:hypothetical protein